MIQGIDVSHWNGDLDWPELAKTYDFAIIKATQGTWFVDDKLLYNVAACGDAGMAHSLYHFLDPIQDGYQNGNEQYEFFVEKTDGLHGVLPNALDVEWRGNLSKAQLTALVLDFLIQEGDWLLYSNLNFLNNILLQPDDISNYADIWLAWPVPTAMKPKYPIHYSTDEVKIWQYDWTVVDKNKVLDEAWYNKYAGEEPVQKAIVRVIAPPGVKIDVIYEG